MEDEIKRLELKIDLQEEEFKKKTATIVIQSVSMTLSIMALIINTILLLKK